MENGESKIIRDKGNNKLIRIGLMLNSSEIKDWQQKSLEAVLSLNYVKLSLIILNDSQFNQPTSFLNKIISYPYSNFFYRFCKRFFIRFSSEKLINIDHIIKNIPSIKCRTLKKGMYSEYFSKHDIEMIKHHELDSIIRFGFNIIRGDILNVAKYGVWSYHHCDEQKYRGGPAALWEIYKGDNINAVILQKLTDKLDSGILLKKVYFQTIKHSYKANYDNIMYAASGLIKQVCIDINNDVANYLQNKPSETKAKIFRFPNNIQYFIFIVKLFCNKTAFHYKQLFKTEQWNIGVAKTTIDELMQTDTFHIIFNNVNWAEKQRNRYFRADSFAYINSGNLNILYENYDYTTRQGNISGLIYDEASGFSEAETMLNAAYHLAYPYTFNYNNETYCIPETSQNNSIDLYRPEGNKLIFHKKLVDNIDAVDTTLFFFDGLWWLFFTRLSHDSNTNLFACYSETFDGEYKPHNNNPIKTDISSARPAGTPFIYNNNLYRPSQNSSAAYGSSIMINKILKLNPSEFEEITVKEIKPDKNSFYNQGIHTISIVHPFIIIDGKRNIFSSDSFMFQLKRKLKRIINYEL